MGRPYGPPQGVQVQGAQVEVLCRSPQPPGGAGLASAEALALVRLAFVRIRFDFGWISAGFRLRLDLA